MFFVTNTSASQPSGIKMVERQSPENGRDKALQLAD